MIDDFEIKDWIIRFRNEFSPPLRHEGVALKLMAGGLIKKKDNRISSEAWIA